MTIKPPPPPLSLWSLPPALFLTASNPPCVIDRFWKRVQLGVGCWLWTGEKAPKGYGAYAIDLGAHWGGRRRVRFRAHRFAWESIYGPIPAGKFACHRCDVPLCVRPDHLFIGTMRENCLDMFLKGRSRTAKLHPDQVREIRRRLKAGEGHKALATAFKVNKELIHDVRLGRAYRWVPDDPTPPPAQPDLFAAV